VRRHGTKDRTFQLLDPRTGDLPCTDTADSHADPANYRAIGPRGGARPVNLNAWTPERRIQLLQDSLQPGDALRHQHNGGVMIRCPFHADRNPSCSVDTRKGGFNCFGCGKHGRFRELIAQMRGLHGGGSIELIGRALGQDLQYREPESDAVAVYPYHDTNGNLVKKVLRFSGKRFVQRCPDSRRRVCELGPMLYNLDRLQFAQVICICEGEKDCETFDGLALHSAQGGDVVPTTSGSADSWHDELADALRGKRVILMPDDDPPGARYAENVAASLWRRGIQSRIVRFRDTGAKDLSDFIETGHSKEELVDRIGGDWVSVTAPSLLYIPAEFQPA
jgi:DNA primase